MNVTIVIQYFPMNVYTLNLLKLQFHLYVKRAALELYALYITNIKI